MPDPGSTDEPGEGPPEAAVRRRRRSRRIDWAVGVMLGIVLGIAVIVGFLVLGSEETIDAPSISGDHVTAPTGSR